MLSRRRSDRCRWRPRFGGRATARARAHGRASAVVRPRLRGHQKDALKKRKQGMGYEKSPLACGLFSWVGGAVRLLF